MIQPDQDGARWNAHADAYERVFEPLTDQFNAVALAHLAPLDGRALIDVGAGSGGAALQAARQGAHVAAVDASAIMVARIAGRGVAHIAHHGAGRITAHHADAAALPFPDASFDRALSSFGIVLLPDPAQGAAELHRVLRPGARAAVVTWTEPQHYALAALLREATTTIAGPPLAGPVPPQLRYVDPTRLHTLMHDAGFVDIRIERIRAVLHATSAESLADALAFAPGMAALLEAMGDHRTAILAEFTRILHRRQGLGAITLPAIAHAAIATRPQPPRVPQEPAMRRRTLMTFAAALAAPRILTPSLARAQAPTLAFTAIPDQDESRLVERFGRVATYLQAQLGTPVAYVPVKTYPAAVTAFTNNQVQLAWFGGFTGVQARRAVPGSDAIAQGVEDTRFRSFFIANTKLGLAKSDDFPRGIEGHSFTFGARASTSGRVMPEYYIRQAFKKAPDQVFSRVGFSGDHTRTLQLVQSGAYEVGAMDFTIYDLEQKAGRVDTSQATVIWQTPTFPDYNWTVRGDLDAKFGPGFKERLRTALVGCTDPAILSQFARTAFIPAANADYAPIEQVAQQTELLD